MQQDHKFKFSDRKTDCPQCGAKKRFSRFIDPNTDQPFDLYGRCDRENSCGYFNLPPEDKTCIYVPITAIEQLTEKAFLIYQGRKSFLIPEYSVYQEHQEGIYVLESFLEKSEHRDKMKVDWSNTKQIDKQILHSRNIRRKPIEATEIYYFPFDVYKPYLSGYANNQFIINLMNHPVHPFDQEDIERVISMYYMGTVGRMISFPFIDSEDRIRAVQVKQFNQDNRTVKTTFLHAIIEGELMGVQQDLPKWLTQYKENDKKVSCLFGEHLLKMYPKNPIILVEAPKTAIYGTLYFGFPNSDHSPLFLAVYNSTSFTLDRIKVLKGRTVIVFPDLSSNGKTFNEWSKSSRNFMRELPGTNIELCRSLEDNSDQQQKNKGFDLADFLIQLDWRDFRDKYQLL